MHFSSLFISLSALSSPITSPLPSFPYGNYQGWPTVFCLSGPTPSFPDVKEIPNAVSMARRTGWSSWRRVKNTKTSVYFSQTLYFSVVLVGRSNSLSVLYGEIILLALQMVIKPRISCKTRFMKNDQLVDRSMHYLSFIYYIMEHLRMKDV